MRHFAITAFAATLALAGVAEASHNRGSALIPSIDSAGNLTIDATSFWRPSFVSDVGSVSITGPGGGSATSVSLINTSGPDTSDTRFTRSNETGSIDISNMGIGLYTISWSGCCRVSGIPNADQSTMSTTSTIFWDGSSATKPITFDIQNLQPNIVRGTAYSDNLGATSDNGDALSYDDSVLTVSLTSQAPGYSIDASGQVNVTAAANSLYADNAGNPGADMAFSGQINAQDASGAASGSVQFDWLFDAVAVGANQVPTVSSIVINATVGDMISQGVTGTDPNGDIVTLSFTDFNGPGGAILGGSFLTMAGDPATGNFTWDSTGFVAGQYVASFFGTDGALSDTGTITINLTAGPLNTVPLPAGLVLLGSGLLGAGFFGRRRRK